MTVLDLISASLLWIGALGVGETPSAEEGAQGLATLNDLLASWSAEQVYIYTQAKDSLTTQAGIAAYDFGPGATAINSTRPLRIVHADVLFGGAVFPVAVIGLADWKGIPDRTAAASDLTKALYCDYAFPIANVNVYPVPKTANGTIELYSLKELASVAALTDTIDLPAGYARALRFALGVDLAPAFGRQLTDPMLALAMSASATLKQLNAQTLRSFDRYGNSEQSRYERPYGSLDGPQPDAPAAPQGN